MSDLYSPAEIAERTGFAYETILRKIRSGELPAQRVFGKLKIRADVYEQWLNDQPWVAPVTKPSPMSRINSEPAAIAGTRLRDRLSSHGDRTTDTERRQGPIPGALPGPNGPQEVEDIPA